MPFLQQARIVLWEMPFLPCTSNPLPDSLTAAMRLGASPAWGGHHGMSVIGP